jgi:ketosteroid isomerase-like protein
MWTAAAAVLLGQAAYAAAVRVLLRRAVRRLREGDVDSLLSLYADDVRFVFPGRNSWAADFRGKADLEPWFRRFVRVGLQLEAHEIFVKGPPWDTSICVRFTDQATAPDGRIVYQNRGTIYGKAAWGKLVFEEAFEDTERIAEFDRWLDEHEHELEPAAT